MKDTYPGQHPRYRYALVCPGSAPESVVVVIPCPTAGHGSFLAGLGYTGILFPEGENGAAWQITLARSEAAAHLTILELHGYRVRNVEEAVTIQKGEKRPR